jgi:hypothetical protein
MRYHFILFEITTTPTTIPQLTRIYRDVANMDEFIADWKING